MTEVEKFSRPLRGYSKRKLIIAMADGTKTMSQLADEFNVSTSAIQQFKERNKAEILSTMNTMNEVLAEEVRGLWIVDKGNRLAEYQSNYEGIGDPGRNVGLLRVGNELLRLVAEELGQIPNKVGLQVNNQQITYILEGINMDELR